MDRQLSKKLDDAKQTIARLFHLGMFQIFLGELFIYTISILFLESEEKEIIQ